MPNASPNPQPHRALRGCGGSTAANRRLTWLNLKGNVSPRKQGQTPNPKQKTANKNTLQLPRDLLRCDPAHCWRLLVGKQPENSDQANKKCTLLASPALSQRRESRRKRRLARESCQQREGRRAKGRASRGRPSSKGNTKPFSEGRPANRRPSSKASPSKEDQQRKAVESRPSKESCPARKGPAEEKP